MPHFLPQAWISAVAVVIVLHFWISEVGGEIVVEPCLISSQDRETLKDEARKMFYHGYYAYKKYAMPYDELKSLSCTGVNSFGGIAVTLIDAMDTLAVLGDWEEFVWVVKYVERFTSWDKNETVSVFETSIRVLGGLLSAHGFLTEAADAIGFNVTHYYPSYNGRLLELASALADILMVAFETNTAIPYGTVHLQTGVPPNETKIASVAGAGTLLLEWGKLSAMTGKEKYYLAAYNAMEGIFSRRAWETDLVGNHIDTASGTWTEREAGIGGTVDSFYEYMLKGYILFGDERLLEMFQKSYTAIQRYLHYGSWYFNVDMESLELTSIYQGSLAAFFFSLEVLYGNIQSAIVSTRAHYTAWRRYGCLPESYIPLYRAPMEGQINYPLRPELAESVFYLHWATNDSSWVGVARSMLFSINTLTRTKCGYARIKNVRSHELEDGMDSFFLSETTKYLYLVFDSYHWLRSGKFVFTTEGHPLLITTWRPSFSQSDYMFATEPSKNQSLPRKCRRRGRLASRSACGFAMPGSDSPDSGLEKLFLSHIPAGVRRVFQTRLEQNLSEGIDKVIYGEQGAYRLVQVPGQRSHEYLVIKMSQFEEHEYRLKEMREERMKTYIGLLRERIQEAGVHQTPAITPADELVAWATRSSRLVCYSEESPL